MGGEWVGGSKGVVYSVVSSKVWYGMYSVVKVVR